MHSTFSSIPFPKERLMRQFNDIAKKTGPNAGGVRMLASRFCVVGNGMALTGSGHSPRTCIALNS
jgi:hypothetical protein